MPIFFGIIAILVVGLLVAAFLSVWGIPLAVIALVGLVAYFARARRHNPNVMTVERPTPVEPTGTTRQASAGTQTSNERVGQA